MIIPQSDEDAYTDKQKRKAEHIAVSYEERNVSENEAERRRGSSPMFRLARRRSPVGQRLHVLTSSFCMKCAPPTGHFERLSIDRGRAF